MKRKLTSDLPSTPTCGILPLAGESGRYPAWSHDPRAPIFESGRHIASPKTAALIHIDKTFPRACFGGPPPMVSHQYDVKGWREYLVTSWPRFWQHYLTVRPRERTYYEMVRSGQPCKLHVDIERSGLASAEAFAATDTLVERFLEWLKARIQECWPSLDTIEHLWLDSGDVQQQKYSVHLILEFPGNRLFADPGQLRAFMEWAYAHAQAHREHEQRCWWPGEPREQFTSFLADMNIYADGDREWRLLYATKRVGAGKQPRYVRPRGTPNTADGPLDEQLFYRALVGYLPPSQRCEGLLTCRYEGARPSRTAGRPRRKAAGGHIDFGDEDVQAVIACFQREIAQAVPALEEGTLEPQDLHHGCLVLRDPARYCAIRGRHHASNGVYYVCWLRRGYFYQRCFDQDCLYAVERQTGQTLETRWAKSDTYFVAPDSWPLLDAYCDKHGVTEDDEEEGMDQGNIIQERILSDVSILDSI